MQAIFHLAKNTYRESLRQPIFMILLLTTLAIIGSYPLFSWFVFREQEKLVVEGSLATILLFGWIIAVLSASHTIAREIDTGTVLLILSKPVSRPVFIFSKILGILTILTIFCLICSAAALMALKSATDEFRFDHFIISGYYGLFLIAVIYGGIRNYFSGRSFPAEVSKALLVLYLVAGIGVYFLPEWKGGYYDWQHGSSGYNTDLMKGLILIMFAVWALGTLATALSTRLNLIGNLSVCFIVFVTGLISRFLYEQLVSLEKAEIEQSLFYWYLALVPIIIFLWILSAKHFPKRKIESFKKWQLHLVFVILVAGLFLQGLKDSLNEVHLQKPGTIAIKVSEPLFMVKNSAAEAFYAAIPNWQHFWLSDLIVDEDPNTHVPFSYIGLAGIYILLFIWIFTVLGMLLFQNREVGNQSMTS